MKLYTWTAGQYPTDEELLKRHNDLELTHNALLVLGPYYAMAANACIQEAYSLELMIRVRELKLR